MILQLRWFHQFFYHSKLERWIEWFSFDQQSTVHFSASVTEVVPGFTEFLLLDSGSEVGTLPTAVNPPQQGRRHGT